MPELPDVDVFRKGIESKSLGRTIRRIEVKDRHVLGGISAQRFRRSFTGRRLLSTRRHGKHLFVETDGPDYLVMHFGMTGEPVYLTDADETPRHARVIFHFEDGSGLVYNCQRRLGRLWLTGSPEKFIEQKHLGPDALTELDWEQFHEVLSSRRGTIKPALMQQELLAGIGNIYSDEILFQAKVHPQRRADDLDETTLRDLYRAMRQVLKTAIARNVQAERFPRSYLLRHRSDRGRCPRCGAALQKAKVSGRTAWFCSNCQS